MNYPEKIIHPNQRGFFMPSPLMLLVGSIVLLTVGFGSGWKVKDWQADAEIAEMERGYAQKREEAVTAARQDERRKQEFANDAVRQQAEKLIRINDTLRADIKRLLTRPPRSAPGVSANPGVSCPPATGAELSREDAEFLIREAARADTIRVALEACYQYADGLKK